MLNRPENPLLSKVDAFTDRILKMVNYLKRKKAEPSILNQVLRSGLSIGANISEAKYAQSRADFVHKMSIALKETNETSYWIDKLRAAESLSEKEYESIKKDNIEILKLLTSIVNTTKNKGL